MGGAALILLFGLWTFTFSSVEGTLIEIEDTDILMSGGYSGTPLVHGSPAHSSSVAVSYRYRVEGERKEGTRVGMGLVPWTPSPLKPMHWDRFAKQGAPLIVYHAPSWPSISVLHRGLDVISIARLAMIGFWLLKFSAWLQQHERPQ